MKKLAIFIVTLIVQTSISAQWINSNPGAGGQVQHVVCDPNITGRMYLCSDMEGFYVSDDFGDHWEYKGWESPFSFVFNIAIEPGNSNRLYLTSSLGLAISDDAGDSWQVVNRFKNISIATISVNPKNKNQICFAESWLESVIGSKSGPAMVHYSNDRGANWESSIFKSYTTDKNVYSINYHPVKSHVIVAGYDGIFVTRDNYNTWKMMAPPENTISCQGADLTPDGKWLYAVFIRKDGNTGIYVKNYDLSGNWQELDPEGLLQSVNQSHWRPKVWPGSDDRSHYVLFGVLKTGGDYNDNALNEGRFIVDNENIYGHVNRILKVQGASEPFDVGWNAYWSHCRTYDYYPVLWEVPGLNRGVFAMSQQSTFRGDAAQPNNWVVNTTHLNDIKNLHKFYRTNGTASTWVWDIAGFDNYVVMGMGDNGVAESWDNGFSWTQKFAPNMWNVDALAVVKGGTNIVLAGRTNGFGGALAETKGWLYYRNINTEKPEDGWNSVIDGNNFNDLKGLDPVLNRIATIQSDPHEPERVYVGTNSGLYVTENIFELIKNNSAYYFKNISQNKIGNTLTRRIHVDPNDENILYLRCWKGTFRIEKRDDGDYNFIKLRVDGSDQNLQDGWGHNGDITAWALDSTITCLAVTRSTSPHREVWLSFDKGENFAKILDKDIAFSVRPPENEWYVGQSPVRFGGITGKGNMFFTSVHLRGGGDGLTKGISFLKATIQPDSSLVWEDFTGDPKNGGIWFPAARSGKIWKDGSGKPAIHIATMGAGMWKRPLTETYNADANFKSNLQTGNLPLEVEFNASHSKPSNNASGIVKYEWDFGDGKTASGKIVSHKYMQEKAFTARLTVTDNLGNIGSAYQIIEGQIYKPVADFVASSYNTKTGHEIRFFGELSYDQNPGDSIVNYQWDFKDGKTKTGKNVTHTYSDWGRFFVKLTVKNSKFQSATVTKSLTVHDNTPAIFTPESNELQVYPNPFSDKINVDCNGSAKLWVGNLSGQKIFARNHFSNNIIINTAAWQPGVYLLSVTHNGKTQFRKIVK